jgi:hypothetical protein
MKLAGLLQWLAVYVLNLKHFFWRKSLQLLLRDRRHHAAAAAAAHQDVTHHARAAVPGC